MYFCVVLCIVCFVAFPVLIVCICVLNNCHRVATQLQLNISYIISSRRLPSSSDHWRPWRWRQQAPPKCWYQHTILRTSCASSSKSTEVVAKAPARNALIQHIDCPSTGGGGAAVSADAGTCGNVACWEMAPSWPRLEKKNASRFFTAATRGSGQEGRDAVDVKERRRGVRQRQREREVRGTAPNVMIFQMFTLAQMVHYLSTPLRASNVTIVKFPIFNYKSCQHVPASVGSRQPHCKSKATGRQLHLPHRTLTLRRLMSCIYGAPILDVSRSHTTTQHSR